MPLSGEIAGKHHGRGWRVVSIILFSLVLFFAFATLANDDKLAKEERLFHAAVDRQAQANAAFASWMRERTEYSNVRDTEWNDRFERIAVKLSEWDVIYKRISGLLDQIEAKKKQIR